MKRIIILLLLILAGYGGYLVGQYQPLEYSNELTQDAYVDVKDENIQLVFYKLSCPYCQVAKKDILKERDKSTYTTYFVDVETDKGRRLAQLFVIKKAATIARIRSGSVTLFQYSKKDETGMIVPDKELIKQAFSEGRN